MPRRDITLRFFVLPFDVDVHGIVPAGRILEWIDKSGYAAAAAWSGQYCVTAYVGNVHFANSLASGDLVEVRSRVVQTGRSSMTILAEVTGSKPRTGNTWPVARCAIVFVATDGHGRTVGVPSWEPETDEDQRFSDDADALTSSRKAIDDAMSRAEYTDAGTGERIRLRFLARPTDVNWGGKVHGGTVMGWIDEAAHAVADRWTGGTAKTVYAGGVRFYQPMFIGDLVEVEARLLHTAGSQLHVSVHVRSGSVKTEQLRLTTHCLLVLDALDDEGRVSQVRAWVPENEEDIALDEHARELESLRRAVRHQQLFVSE